MSGSTLPSQNKSNEYNTHSSQPFILSDFTSASSQFQDEMVSGCHCNCGCLGCPCNMPLSAVDNDTREIDYDDHSDSEEYNDGRDFLASLTDLANNCVMTNDSRRSSETSHYDSVRGDDSVTTADSDHQNDPQEIYDFLSQIHELHPFSIHQQFGFIASPPFHCTSFSPNNDLSPSSSMHVNLEASPQHSTISMHSHMTRSQSPAFYTRHAGSCFNENGPLPLLDGSKSRRLGSIGSPLANSASLSDIVMQDH